MLEVLLKEKQQQKGMKMEICILQDKSLGINPTHTKHVHTKHAHTHTRTQCTHVHTCAGAHKAHIHECLRYTLFSHLFILFLIFFINLCSCLLLWLLRSATILLTSQLLCRPNLCLRTWVLNLWYDSRSRWTVSKSMYEVYTYYYTRRKLRLLNWTCVYLTVPLVYSSPC